MDEESPVGLLAPRLEIYPREDLIEAEAANRNALVFASTSFLLIFSLAAPERERGARRGGEETYGSE